MSTGGGSSSNGASSQGASGTPSDGGVSSLVGSINQARKLQREFRKMHETVKNIGKTLDEIFDKTYKLKVDTSAINQANPDDNKKQRTFAVQPAFRQSNMGLFFPISLFSKNPIQVPMTANTQPIASKLQSLGQLAQNVGQMLAKGLTSAVSSAMDLEHQMMSIQHTVGNAQKDGKGGEKSRAYIEEIKKMGSTGPFSTDDLMKAGMDAVRMNGGNTNEALSMLKIAQDIAALNPGKSVDDAMNGLMALKGGKADALSDFGFTLSQSEAKAAKSGKGYSTLKSDNGKTLTETFSGGTDKFAKTSKGMVNTLKSSLAAGMQDAGTIILKSLQPKLQQLVGMIHQFGPVFKQLGQFAAMGINAVIAKVSAFVNWISPYMPTIIENIQAVMGQMSATMGPIFDQVLSLFKNVFDWVVNNMPIFKDAINIVFATAEPLIRGVMDVFQSLWKAWEEAWPTIQKILTKAWETMQPIFTFLQDALRLAAFVIEDQFKPAIDMLWTVFEPLLEAIKNTMSWLGDRFGNLVDWITGETTPPQDRKDPQAKPHAAGLRTVPRDNYPALLHKNEAVLTAQEANQYRNGRFGGRGVTINLNHPVAREEADFAKWAQVLRAELEGAGVNMA